jgi:hypothetical protein
VVAAVLAVLAAVNAASFIDWINAHGQRLWVVALAAAALYVLPLAMIEPRFRMAARGIGRLLYP